MEIERPKSNYSSMISRVGAVNDHGYQMCFDIQTEEERYSSYEKKSKIPQGKEVSYHAT